MHKYFLAAVFWSIAMLSGISMQSNAAPVPCADLQVKLETALKTKKPADADKTKIDELKARGDERCKSEDDRRAEGFYAQALLILGMRVPSAILPFGLLSHRLSGNVASIFDVASETFSFTDWSIACR